MTDRIIVNATHLGERLNGIGSYVLNLLHRWAAAATDVEFEVHLHPSARVHLDDVSFPENFSLRWIGASAFGDRDNVRRLLFSNLLAAGRRGDVIFNPSQLEMTFVGARQIVTVHDLIPLLVDPRSQRRQRYFLRYVAPWGLRSAAAIVTGSHATREALCAAYGLHRERIRVIPYGVRRFAASGEMPAGVRGRKYILFAGRIVPYRNIERLIAAFVRIQDRIEHDLVLAGEAFYDAKIPRDNPRIVARGHVSDEELHALYRGASVFVFPSLGEGFGLPPLEAMSCGCPVIASREASLPEVCESAAFWVDARSVQSIADGVCAVLFDDGLRSRLVNAGRRRAAELTWERSARAHLELFAEVFHARGEAIGAR